MPRMFKVVLAYQGVGHLTEGLLTLHNLMADAGINVKQQKTLTVNLGAIPDRTSLSESNEGCVPVTHQMHGLHRYHGIELSDALDGSCTRYMLHSPSPHY